MSHTGLTLAACPDWQDRLEDYFINQTVPHSAMAARNEVALVTTLMQAENRSNFHTKLMPGQGKYRDLQLIYTPRPILDEISSSPDHTCDAGNTAGHQSTTYQVDTTKGVSYKETYQLTDLEPICQDNPSWFEETILRLMSACDRKLEDASWADVAAGLVGNFSSTETSMVAGS